MASNLIAMAYNLVAMASNLVAQVLPFSLLFSLLPSSFLPLCFNRGEGS